MLPSPRNARIRLVCVKAPAPGTACGPSVTSWFCGRYAAPISTAFRLTSDAVLERAETVVAVVADVGDVHDRRPRQGLLDAGLPLRRRRNLGVVLEGRHARDRSDAQALAEVLQLAVAEVVATSRSAGCPESRTPCCRRDGRRRCRRRRGRSRSAARSRHTPHRTAGPTTSVGQV